MNINTSVFSLNLEQQFQLKILENSIEQMSREQMKDILMQLSQLTMIKDNVIQDLLKSDISSRKK